jgi:hypothetical protein
LVLKRSDQNLEQIPGVPKVAEFVDDELSSLGEEADGKPSVFFGFESICVVSGGPSGLESPQTGEGEYSNELTDASGFGEVSVLEMEAPGFEILEERLDLPPLGVEGEGLLGIVEFFKVGNGINAPIETLEDTDITIDS